MAVAAPVIAESSAIHAGTDRLSNDIVAADHDDAGEDI